MRRSDFVQSINAIAIHDNGEEYEFDFEISNNATEKDKVDKAFEIAYCKFINLEEVRITNQFIIQKIIWFSNSWGTVTC